jgi:hypothetical protein
MEKPQQYIVDAWARIVADAKKQLEGDCPLLEDECIVTMHDNVVKMEQRIAELEAKCEAAWLLGIKQGKQMATGAAYDEEQRVKA